MKRPIINMELQLIFLIQFSCLITMENSKNLLRSFNQCTFNNTTQILISSLDYSDLQQLLQAVENLLQFEQLSQLIRGRMVVLLYQKNDRSIYYSYFEVISLAQIKEERSNLIAANYSKNSLNALLQSYESLTSKGRLFYGEEFSQIREAVLQPILALPPIKRETVAPSSQTIYQVTLAFQKLKCQEQEENDFTLNSKTGQFFQECLAFQIQMAFCYVNSINDEFQHFAELSYRFMVYRNTVLSLHSLCPFSDITKTMKLWTSRMHNQYLRSNKVFLKLLGLEANDGQKCGFFSFQELKQQCYMMDYIEGLVDQSITEDNVAFCGHSKQKFRGPYAMLQNLIVQWVKLNRNYIQQTLKVQQIQKNLEKWADIGLRPSTTIKIIEILNEFVEGDELGTQLCCRDDYFIENCARINGLSFPDNSQVHGQCF